MDLVSYLADRRPGAGETSPIVIRGATRADLPEFLRRRGAKVGVEVGVYRGDYSELLCQGIPGLHLYCVDWWSPFLGADGRPIYRSTVDAYDVARERLTPYGCTLVRQESPGAAVHFANESLDFVYLDADHRFAHVVADLFAWLPKLKRGGIIAGHDYEEHPNKHNQVSTAVRAWTEAYGVAPWYVLGRRKVLRGEPYEKSRTWFWENTAVSRDLARRRY